VAPSCEANQLAPVSAKNESLSFAVPTHVENTLIIEDHMVIPNYGDACWNSVILGCRCVLFEFQWHLFTTCIEIAGIALKLHGRAMAISE
jgi:hypothetical protein